MARKVLKGFAIAAGLGLALISGSGKRRGKENSMRRHLPDNDLVSERLDRIESRLSAVERQPPAVAELDLWVQQQAREIEMLELELTEHKQKVAGEIATIEKRFADLAKGIPAVLESIIIPRVDDLRVHLRSELQQSVNVTLTRFERAIDDKISHRIATLEKAMLDQSSIVTALGRRAVESDMNLQRLISAVERLCEKTNQKPPARQELSVVDLPLKPESRKPEIPAPPFESAFRPRIVKEDEDDRQTRHRIPLARL